MDINGGTSIKSLRQRQTWTDDIFYWEPSSFSFLLVRMANKKVSPQKSLITFDFNSDVLAAKAGPQSNIELENRQMNLKKPHFPYGMHMPYPQHPGGHPAHPPTAESDEISNDIKITGQINMVLKVLGQDKDKDEDEYLYEYKNEYDDDKYENFYK
jgi:hypothetical protein